MRIAVLWAIWMLLSSVIGWHLGARSRPGVEANATTHSPAKTNTLLGRSILGTRSSTAASRVRGHPGLTCPIEDLPGQLTAAMGRSKSGHSFEIQLLLAHWHQVDRKAARRWMLSEKRGQALLQTLARLWLQEDLENAWLESSDRNHEAWHRALCSVLAIDDPASLFLGVDTEHFRTDSVIIRDAAERWAKESFERAALAIEEMPSSKLQMHAVAGLAQAKAKQSSADEALKWANGYGAHAEVALSAIIDQTAKTDLEAALQKLESFGITQSKSYHALSEIQQRLRQLPVREQIALLSRYPVNNPYLVSSITDLPSDPLEAARLLAPIAELGNSLPFGRYHPKTDDIRGTLTTFAQDADQPLARALLKQCLNTWSEDPSGEVVAWLQSLSDPVKQTHYASDALAYQMEANASFELLNLIDPELISKEDTHIPYRIHNHIGTSMESIASMDPTRAITKASLLDHPDWRHQAYRKIAATWAAHDEAAALELLATFSQADQIAISEHLPRSLRKKLGHAEFSP